MTKTKVAVIGLDGCSPRYLEKIINHGFVPTIRSIVEKHGYYKLYAFPPCTPPSWSSIMTGVNPGKHGIFGFQHYDKQEKRVYLTNTMHLEHPRVHEMLGLNGIPSIVINPIPSYPLIPVKNTIQISHMFFTPRLTWYPSEIGKYAKLLEEHNYRSKTRDELLERASSILDKYVELVENLTEKLEWQLFWINLHYPDTILHHFDEEWVFEKPYYLEGKIFGKIDHIVKILSEQSDYTILVSDHGFAHYYKIINVNSYLYSKGYTRKAVGDRGLREFWEHRQTEDYFAVRNKMILKLANTRIIGKLMGRVKRISEKILGKKIKVTEYNVDTIRSKAFLLSTYSHGVIVNDITVKDHVARELRMLEGIRYVVPSSKMFNGYYVDRAPDLLVIPDYDRGYSLGKNKISYIVIRRREINNHHPIGIFIINTNDHEHMKDMIIPNYAVTNIIMLLLNQQPSYQADGLRMAEKITGKKIYKLKNYNAWNILKKIAKVRVPKV